MRLIYKTTYCNVQLFPKGYSRRDNKVSFEGNLVFYFYYGGGGRSFSLIQWAVVVGENVP